MPGVLSRCARCDCTWTGVDLAHCDGCHLLFEDAATFDAHRVRGKCLDVSALTPGRVFLPVDRKSTPCKVYILIGGNR